MVSKSMFPYSSLIAFFASTLPLFTRKDTGLSFLIKFKPKLASCIVFFVLTSDVVKKEVPLTVHQRKLKLPKSHSESTALGPQDVFKPPGAGEP